MMGDYIYIHASNGVCISCVYSHAVFRAHDNLNDCKQELSLRQKHNASEHFPSVGP